LTYQHFQAVDTKALFTARNHMADQVVRYFQEHVKGTSEVPIVALEDYDLNPSQQVGYQIAEVGGIVKHNFYLDGIPFTLVNPRKLKSYVVRKKNVSKNEVIAWASERGFTPPVKPRGGSGYDKRQREDLADAYVLARMARDLKMFLAEQTPAQKGHIFLDPQYGLADRQDLLHGIQPLARSTP
jgi:hypothetical protein